MTLLKFNHKNTTIEVDYSSEYNNATISFTTTILNWQNMLTRFLQPITPIVFNLALLKLVKSILGRFPNLPNSFSLIGHPSPSQKKGENIYFK